VREISEEYDAHAIAAAALQLAYDQTRPDWLKADSIPEEDANYASPKPKLRSSSRRSSGDRSRRWSEGKSRDGKRGAGSGGGSATSKPKLKSSHRESSMHHNQLGSGAAQESAS
jgi:ATP-dependent RNA helicase DeaD